MHSMSVCLIRKYAYIFDVLCFDVVVLCTINASSHLITYIFRAVPLASRQFYGCPSACNELLKDMSNIDQY